jgi:hypothetical protein
VGARGGEGVHDQLKFIDRHPLALDTFDERVLLAPQPLILVGRVDQQVETDTPAKQGQVGETTLEKRSGGRLDQHQVEVAPHVGLASGEGAEHDRAEDRSRREVIPDPALVLDLRETHWRRAADDLDVVHRVPV